MEDARFGQAWRNWEHLIRSVRESTLICDYSGTITSIRAGRRDLLGAASVSVEGQSLSDIFLQPSMFLIPERERPFNGRIQLDHGDEIPIVGEFSALDNNAARWSLTIRHAEDLKLAGAGLLAGQRLASIGSLTSGVARELKNPLSIIAATCGNLHYSLIENENTEVTDALNVIEGAAFRGADIVDVIHSYTQLGEPRMAITDLETLVHDALALVKEQYADDSAIDIIVEMPPGRRSLVCDHQGITQVLVILLLNAVESLLSGGGTICIKAWPVADPFEDEQEPLSLEGMPYKNAAAFSVADGGAGIAPHILARLFEPFMTTKNGQTAGGMGLFVARNIVQQHQGKIWAQNNGSPLGGATFTVVLPRRPIATS